eukprot:5212390-Heterocapsa_arctica.AAC.1
MAIGAWKHNKYWQEACTKQRIGYIADFLATRLTERRMPSKFGAVRLTRAEAMNIVDEEKHLQFLCDSEGDAVRVCGRCGNICGCGRYGACKCLQTLHGMWQRALCKGSEAIKQPGARRLGLPDWVAGPLMRHVDRWKPD